jgi:predicted negative regulator of RcsB-dependent stress response
MAAQSLASRSRRPPQGPDSEDVVLARALEFSQWARRHARVIVIVAVLAAVVVGGLVVWRWNEAARSERAAADFLALEPRVTATDPATGIADLQRFIQLHDGTTYADEARVLLGRLHLEQGQPTEAIAPLQEAARRIGRSPIGAQAGLLLGAAQEQAGDTPAAVETYLRVANDARSPFAQRQALEAASAAYEAAGNHAGAAGLYRQLIGLTEEGSFERSVYEMRLAEAEHQSQVQAAQ